MSNGRVFGCVLVERRARLCHAQQVQHEPRREDVLREVDTQGLPWSLFDAALKSCCGFQDMSKVELSHCCTSNRRSGTASWHHQRDAGADGEQT